MFTVSAAVNAISDLLEIALFVRIMGGEPVTEAEVLGNDLRQSILGIVHFIIYLVTAVLFLRWTYLANWNARILGAPDLKPSPGWAVGWYFVPIANLWKPFQALRQTFKASHPDYTENWQEAPSPALLLLCGCYGSSRATSVGSCSAQHLVRRRWMTWLLVPGSCSFLTR